MSDTDSIGGARKADLAEVRKEIASSPSVSSGTPQAFLRTFVRSCLRPWMSAIEHARYPVALVYCEEAKSLAAKVKLKRVSAIRQIDPRQIFGRVLLCGANISHGWEFEETVASANEVEMLLQTVGAAECCLVLLTPGSDVAIAYPLGFLDQSPSIPLATDGVVLSVNPTAVDEELVRFYERIRSPHPNVYPRLWHDGARYVPIESTENELQGALGLWLHRACNDSVVLREKPNSYGYSDIILSQVINGKETGERGVVELKVLRQKHFKLDASKALNCAPSVNDAAISEGLKQAIAYTSAEGADFAFACFYDMRQKNDEKSLETSEVASAIAQGVLPRRYYVFSTVERARDADVVL